MPAGDAIGTPTYFGSLDTIQFQRHLDPDTLSVRLASASMEVMLQLLLTGSTPMLPQSQAFDCPLILGSLQRFDQDSLALLNLARDGQIQVGILDSSALREDPPDGARFTVLNAFCSTLANRPDFEYSAWPELADAPLRAAVRDQLSRDPEGITRVVDGELQQRLLALVEFDRALRQANAVRPVRVPPGTRLAENIVTHLADAISTDPAGRDLYIWLLTTVKHTDDWPQRYSNRSIWRELVRRYRQERGPDLPDGIERAAAAVDGWINGEYHKMIARSLEVAELAFDIPDFDSWATHRDREFALTFGHRAARLREDPELPGWLTWDEVRRVQRELRALGAADSRVAYLVTRHREWVTRRQVDDRLRHHLWTHVKVAHVSLAGGVVGAVVGLLAGGPTGVLLGSGIGAAASSYANYLLDVVKARDERRVAQRVDSEQAAAWQPTIRSTGLPFELPGAA